MPKVTWGIKSADIDEFDRDSQYKPYMGPIPVNGVYEWQIKVLKSVAATKDKNPQLRVGLQLVPREGRKEEKKYNGYFIMAFITITDKMMWKLAPFLDAIGVSGREFTNGTMTDEEGNIKKIGRWRNTGDVMIAAELKDGSDEKGNPRKEVGWMGPLSEEEEEDEEELEDDEDIDEEDYFEDDEDE